MDKLCMQEACFVDRCSELIKVFETLEETRYARGIRYCCGILTFCLFLCESAQAQAQSAKQIWLFENWDLIKIFWNLNAKKKNNRESSPSQSCISRFLSSANSDDLTKSINSFSRDNFALEWEKYREDLKSGEVKMSYKNSGTDNRKQSKICHGEKPHFAFDGKARKGVVSEATGRTEIDLTLFCSDTNQILIQKTLPDKEGEPVAAEEMIKEFGKILPEGVVTGDAGITCPRVISALNACNQNYILNIKGNAGKIYEQIEKFEWDSVSTKYVQLCEGHGRQEIRELKCITLSQLNSSDYKKYDGAKVVYALDKKTHYIKKATASYERRFFIGDEYVSNLTLPQVATYIRKHWMQESYHWVKDVVLHEDNSTLKSSNGSRFLSVIKSQVFTVGKKICKSVKTFTVTFSANPRRFLSHLNKK